MAGDYWIVNLLTKEYFPCNDDTDFFEGDWKQKTPWPDERYVNLSAQKVYSDQIFEKDKAFYGYDLCQRGMLVGVYYDKDLMSRNKIDAAVKQLRRQHDVAFLMRHALKKCDDIIDMDDLPPALPPLEMKEMPEEMKQKFNDIIYTTEPFLLAFCGSSVYK